MTGALDRFKTLMREDLNARLVRSRHPDRLLDEYVNRALGVRGELREELVNARAELLLVVQRQNASEEQARKWGRRAMAAVERGEEDEARTALRRQKSFEDALDDWGEAISAHEQTVAGLERASRKLAELLEDAQLRMASLISRQRAARAAQKVQAVLQAVGETDAHEHEAMEEMVEGEEARAAAMAEVAARTVEEHMARFERGAADMEIEARLEDLKKRVRGCEDTDERE